MGLSGSKEEEERPADEPAPQSREEPAEPADALEQDRRRAQREADLWAMRNPVLQDAQQPDASNVLMPDDEVETWIARDGGGFERVPAAPNSP